MKKLGVLWLVLLLAACGGQVKFGGDSDGRKAITAKHYTFNNIMISYNDKAKEKLSKYPGFKAAKLKQTVTGYFKKQGLLSEKSVYRLEFKVTDLFLRSAIKAFLLPISDPDKMDAIVIVKDASGKVVESFKVDSSYSLGGTTSTLAAVRTQLLFKNLSQLVSDVFTGKNREAKY